MRRNIKAGVLSCIITLMITVFIAGGIAVYCDVQTSFNEDFSPVFYVRQGSKNSLEFNSFGSSYHIDLSFLDSVVQTVSENPYIIPAPIRVFSELFTFLGQL